MTRRANNGFTLIETVIVVALIGLIAVVLAAAFTAIVRNAPTAEDRTDDSRSLLGLTNWLPQDVSSTEPTGFRQGDQAIEVCTGGIPASQGLLDLRWTAEGTTFAVYYRFVDGGPGSGTIVRYSCSSAAPTAQADRLTSPLQKVSGGASEAPAPVDITLRPDPGNPGEVLGLDFVVTVVDDSGTQRELLSLDATTANVHTTLPPATTVVPATTTTTTTAPPIPPVAFDITVNVNPDGSITFALPAIDPDGPAPTYLSNTYPSTNHDLLISSLGDLDLHIYANHSASGSTVFDYTVIDDDLLQATGQVTVIVDTTTPSTSTTSSTTTTTTTTTVPCSAAITSVNPNPVGVKSNGKLVDNVVVRIAWSGACDALVLTFDPDTTDFNTTLQQRAFDFGTTVTIGKSDYVWNSSGSSPWSFPLQLRQGANGPIEDTVALLALVVN